MTSLIANSSIVKTSMKPKPDKMVSQTSWIQTGEAPPPEDMPTGKFSSTLYYDCNVLVRYAITFGLELSMSLI